MNGFISSLLLLLANTISYMLSALRGAYESLEIINVGLSPTASQDRAATSTSASIGGSSDTCGTQVHYGLMVMVAESERLGSTGSSSSGDAERKGCYFDSVSNAVGSDPSLDTLPKSDLVNVGSFGVRQDIFEDIKVQHGAAIAGTHAGGLAQTKMSHAAPIPADNSRGAQQLVDL